MRERIASHGTYSKSRHMSSFLLVKQLFHVIADGKLSVAKARKKVKAKAKMRVPKQQCTVKGLLQKVQGLADI